MRFCHSLLAMLFRGFEWVLGVKSTCEATFLLKLFEYNPNWTLPAHINFEGTNKYAWDIFCPDFEYEQKSIEAMFLLIRQKN